MTFPLCPWQLEGGYERTVEMLLKAGALAERFNHLLMAIEGCPMQGSRKRVGLDVGSALEEHFQPSSHGHS